MRWPWRRVTLAEPAGAEREQVDGVPVDATVADVMALPISEAQAAWLRKYEQKGAAWAEANNPPNFVTDEACWGKAKRAAQQAGASDVYAFANYWYHEHCASARAGGAAPSRSVQRRLRGHAIALNEPATEVRLFRAGDNPTSKGTFVFDDASAREVLAAASNDVMIDLEHLSLDTESRAFDPDARGWGRLEVRAGALWLTQIRWTADGAERIRSRRQRYVSPAFDADENGRIMRLVNVAITALPATDDAQALIAAAQRQEQTRRLAAHGAHMDPKLVKDAIAALKEGNGDGALAILEQMIAAAAGAPAAAPAPEGEAMGEHGPPPGEEEKKQEGQAMSTQAATQHLDARAIADLTGEIKRLAGEVVKLRKERDADERGRLVAQHRAKFPGKLAELATRWELAQIREFIAAAPDHTSRELIEPAAEPVKLREIDTALARELVPAKDLERHLKLVQQIRERDAARSRAMGGA